jgi:DNA-binding MarR family transcriptional regulator
MDPKAIKTLKVLEALEANHAQSQRDLSKSLNISLGLVNSIIKRISQKGYFKPTDLAQNKIRYLLSSEGIAAKEKLSHQYARFSLTHYTSAKRQIQKLFARLSQHNLKKIIFFGVSEFAEIAYITIKDTDLDLLGIVDEGMAGNQFLGMQVQNLSFLHECFFDMIVITKNGKTFSPKEELIQKAIPDGKKVEVINGDCSF